MMRDGTVNLPIKVKNVTIENKREDDIEVWHVYWI